MPKFQPVDRAADSIKGKMDEQRYGFAIGAKVGAFSRDELLTWNGKTKPGNREKERTREKGETQGWEGCRHDAGRGERGGKRKKCSQKWSSMNQSLPRSFQHGLYLSRVLYGLWLKNRSWTTSQPFFSFHPCPSCPPSIINCFVQSLFRQSLRSLEYASKEKRENSIRCLSQIEIELG